MDSPKKRLLIVDDEKELTDMLKTRLEHTGKYSIRTENQGSHVLAVAVDFQPDLILLDVIMPTMDGPDVAGLLKEDAKTKNIPIIFLTAAVRREEAESCHGKIGGHPFMAKPVDIKDLIECIDMYLRKNDEGKRCVKGE